MQKLPTMWKQADQDATPDAERLLVYVAAIGVVLVSAGCMSVGSITSRIRQRAVHELNCPAKQIVVRRISPDDVSAGGVYGARGCGRRMSYRISCTVLNECGEIRAVGGSRLGGHNSRAPAPAAGCSYDTQCKGNRMCVRGRCVAPSGP